MYFFRDGDIYIYKCIKKKYNTLIEVVSIDFSIRYNFLFQSYSGGEFFCKTNTIIYV